MPDPTPIATLPEPTGPWEKFALERHCYCGLWDKKPEVLEKQGLMPGFCGKCERCGKPGHARHYPGPVPYTGAWCDRCYKIVAWTAPLRSPMLWIVALVVAAIFYFR